MTTTSPLSSGFWLPLTASVLAATGWRKDDAIEVEVVDKDTLVLRRVDPGSTTGRPK